MTQSIPPVRAIRPLLVVFVLLLVVAALAWAAPRAGANPGPVWTVVTKTADTNDGVCDADCSLREAVTATEGNVTADIIMFDIPAGDAGCTAANECTVLVTSVLPTITEELTIGGVGGDITLDGGNSTQLLDIAATAVVTLRQLTIVNFDSGGSSLFSVGAIVNAGDLTVENSTFANNTGGSFAGGAISHIAGAVNLTISGSTFVNNTGGVGGAINAGGPFAITNSTFSNNSGSVGGAISLLYVGGGDTQIITNSTFYNNEATNPDNVGGTLHSAEGSIRVVNSIIDNGSEGPTACAAEDGGSIINGGGMTTNDSSCSNSVFASTGLDTTLADNGGPTHTHALLPTSPAIDRIENALCTGDPVQSVDQRGQPRNVDIPGQGGDASSNLSTAARSSCSRNRAAPSSS